MTQAALMRPFSYRLFVDAGISAGMRVLDLGCGVGDVSLLLADLVGPTGSVVGADRDPCSLEVAREHAWNAPQLTSLSKKVSLKTWPSKTSSTPASAAAF